MTAEADSETKRPAAPRWGLAFAILVIGNLLMMLVWVLDFSRQERIIKSAGVILFTSALLFFWAVFFSRFRGRTRFRIFLTGVLFVAIAASSLRIKGVTGDLVPIVGFRWKKNMAAPIGTEGGLHSPSGVSSAAEFPQFLGPNRNGNIPNVHLNTNWTEHPPRQLWKIAVGEAWTGFVVSKGFAITQEQRGPEELVTCYDLQTGKLIWSHAEPVHYGTTIAGEGPRSNPTISGDRVYTYGATGILNCLDLASGKLNWSKDMVKEHAIHVPDWGYAGAPLLHDGAVILNVGAAKKRSLVAHDAATGQFLWGAGEDSTSYSSPTILTLNGVEQIIMFSDHVTGHDVRDGSVLWKHHWQAGHPHITLPIAISTNQILVSSGYGYGSELLEISRATNNAWQAERVWKSNRLKSKFANLILRKGFVYGLDDGTLVCLDPATGERRWQGDRYGHGQLLLVGDVILFTSEKGEVLLLDPTPEVERIIARFPTLKGKMWNPPALAGEYLLVRNNREAACYKVALQTK
jgi:outer membrane protein assembly factor BamB